MKKILFRFIVLSICCYANDAFAQQPAQFSQYMFNTLYYNPAFAGVNGATTFSFIGREQWFGYTGSFDNGGAPRTGILSLNTPVLLVKSGVGMYYVYDQLGAQQNE